jgi:hypothetical protein
MHNLRAGAEAQVTSPVQPAVSIVACNRSLSDILLRDQVDSLAEGFAPVAKVHHLISSPPPGGWSGGGMGRFVEATARDHLPKVGLQVFQVFPGEGSEPLSPVWP